jgi:hypothetical protein
VDKGGDEGVGGCQKWVRVIAGFKLQTYVHCKKRLACFPSPGGMSITKHSGQ